MNTKYTVGIVFLAGTIWGADSGRPLDVRPGMWESTTTTQASGTPSIPPEILAKMTPEQKAAFEARMKAGMPQGPQTRVTKHCVTQEELSKGLTFGDEHRSCQRTVVSSSSSKQEIRMECSSAGITAKGTIRIEALDAEHLKVSSEFTSGDGPHGMKISVTGTGKWVSDACTTDGKK
jgi:hypothetical protein